ncbi:BolA-like protein 1 [Portunus trituberculatus]|uniref:BolA-like protein 1 n=1 Tax=Portunus trituberculatus TaxID=210409 RepID=A0A5B7FFK5_PORTR|nr:BolA-like protein 1 [Portunus trituberculatus]
MLFVKKDEQVKSLNRWTWCKCTCLHLTIFFISGGPVELLIKNKLNEALHPSHMEIVNESFMHNVPPGSETHFKILVVSEAFDGLPLIKRHRLVNTTLDEELKTGVHALSIVAKTPAQWSENPQQIESSPACRGGFGK